ncbi:PREDICTED: uncharacterized protein LOC109163059 [Ipomoea nil]|uniref:uncharacterized protein LOC109163059 n=1 Tax=Ipomoea nil TaxID=35883 RepID=UPI00090117E5|nr:PREDICTED: uncharacterized protein LOC109163059 [Ipomoea nil]
MCCNNSTWLDRFVGSLSAQFALKDLGTLHHFLGVEVIPTGGGIFLSQSQYITGILTQFKMDGAKDVSTPLATSEKLVPLRPSDVATDATQFRRLLGLMQYLVITRPDVAFAVNRLSQFMHAPSELHWQAAKRLLRYLKGTACHGLLLRAGQPLSLRVYTDSDWGGPSIEGRSTTAYLVYLGDNLISWKSTRQKSVSRSSTEAEYRALSNAAAEVLWVKNLLQELKLGLVEPPVLFCDNLSATYVCKNPVFHSRMKHLTLEYYFVWDLVANGTLVVRHVSSSP